MVSAFGFFLRQKNFFTRFGGAPINQYIVFRMLCALIVAELSFSAKFIKSAVYYVHLLKFEVKGFVRTTESRANWP